MSCVTCAYDGRCLHWAPRRCVDYTRDRLAPAQLHVHQPVRVPFPQPARCSIVATPQHPIVA